MSWQLATHQKSALVCEALMDGIERFGKPEEVLSDQGRQYFAWRGKSDFQRLLVREGIRHVVSRTHHPETLGKCERLWETLWSLDATQLGRDERGKVEAVQLRDVATTRSLAPAVGGPATAEDVVAVLERAKEERGRLPLALALDNGPAHRNERVRAYLAGAWWCCGTCRIRPSTTPGSRACTASSSSSSTRVASSRRGVLSPRRAMDRF